MNDIFSGITRRKFRHPIQPQLTAMVDVFSMITVFLVAGTVFDSSSIVLPSYMQLPLSSAQEGISSAPQIILERNGVHANFLSSYYPYQVFNPALEAALYPDPDLSRLLSEIKAFVTHQTGKAKPEGLLLNVVADRSLKYNMIYDVIQVFRKNGFESIHFVSIQEGSSQ